MWEVEFNCSNMLKEGNVLVGTFLTISFDFFTLMQVATLWSLHTITALWSLLTTESTTRVISYIGLDTNTRSSVLAPRVGC